jgi:hypothetical protein
LDPRGTLAENPPTFDIGHASECIDCGRAVRSIADQRLYLGTRELVTGYLQARVAVVSRRS